MSKLKESTYIANLKSYTNGKTYVNLVGLLDCRLEKLKDELVDASDEQYKKIQGQAKEVKYLLSCLTRETHREQFTGAFN